jgi:putative peptidoglycan lipid II flippase
MWTRLSGNYLLRNASITATLAAAGAVTGLVLDAIIVYTFGADFHTDALFAALTIPTLLIGVFSIQSPKVLVPIFSELFDRGAATEAWALVRSLASASLVIFGGVTVAGIVLSALLLPVQIPGLKPEAIALAVWLSRILFALVLMQGLGATLQPVLYAQHSYLIACSGKLVMNVTTLIVVVLGASRFGIQAVAFGMVLGSAIQVMLLFLALARQGFRLGWSFDRSDRRLREILGSFRYPVAGHVLGESGTLLQNAIGSFLGSGTLTLLRYASRIVQAIAGILLGSVVQVTLPLVAKHAAASDLRLQRRTLLESMQLVVLVGLPICIWLVFAAEPLVVLLFQRGHFTAADAVVTAVIIRYMVPDLLLGRICSVTQTLFYANSDLRTPFISTVIFTVVNAMGAIVFAKFLGVRGIGLAVAVASLSNTMYMLWKLQQRYAPMGWRERQDFARRLGLTCTLAGLGFAFGSKLFPGAAVFESAGRLMAVIVPSVLGFGLFGAGALAFRLLDVGFIAPNPNTGGAA